MECMSCLSLFHHLLNCCYSYTWRYSKVFPCDLSSNRDANFMAVANSENLAVLVLGLTATPRLGVPIRNQHVMSELYSCQTGCRCTPNLLIIKCNKLRMFFLQIRTLYCRSFMNVFSCELFPIHGSILSQHSTTLMSAHCGHLKDIWKRGDTFFLFTSLHLLN